MGRELDLVQGLPALLRERELSHGAAAPSGAGYGEARAAGGGGAMKDSGRGRFGGAAAIDEYTELKW
jgi:hypothetical protein